MNNLIAAGVGLVLAAVTGVASIHAVAPEAPPRQPPGAVVGYADE